MRTTVTIFAMRKQEALESARDVLRRRHYSLATEEAYLGWIARFIDFLIKNRRLTSSPSERKIEAFLTALARADVAASTQNQAFNALLFFYRNVRGQQLGNVEALRARRAERIRVAPPVETIRNLLDVVRDEGGYPTRLIVRMLYGCGLRVSEPLNLRLRDILLDESRLILRQAKGNKDRVVELPCELIEELRVQMLQAHATAKSDCMNGIPVPLPGRLAVKNPRLQWSERWAWLFPMHRPCIQPRTGVRVRYRVLESMVQRAVRRAVARLGTDIEIVPHLLRHAWATHAKLHLGADLVDLRAALGHKDISTTMRYLAGAHVTVRSPLILTEKSRA